MISLNIPPCSDKELDYMKEALENRKLYEENPFTKNVPNGWKTVKKSIKTG